MRRDIIEYVYCPYNERKVKISYCTSCDWYGGREDKTVECDYEE